METFGSKPLHMLTVGKPQWFGGPRWHGECDCSNPDGYGDGGMFWWADSAQEVHDAWWDHFVDVTVFADDVGLEKGGA